MHWIDKNECIVKSKPVRDRPILLASNAGSRQCVWRRNPTTV